MGEARRKKQLMKKEWTPLFSSGDYPIHIAISRLTKRLKTTKLYEENYVTEVLAAAKTDKPALCFNTECPNELKAIPHTRIFVQVKDNLPLAMGACSSCEKKDNEAIRKILQRTFNTEMPQDAIQTAISIDNVRIVPINETMKIAVEQTDDENICRVAQLFYLILKANRLPRLVTYWYGKANCHLIVNQLYYDLKDSGLPFSYKRGSSERLRSKYDPEGLHSWIELDGWAIDASSGAANGGHILILTTSNFYKQFQLTNIQDIDIEK